MNLTCLNRFNLMVRVFRLLLLCSVVCGLSLVIDGKFANAQDVVPENDSIRNRLPRIGLSDDKATFRKHNGDRFEPWGFNYLGLFDHLAEEDWDTTEGWKRIERDFAEMKRLHANVVRWHLQYVTFMESPTEANVEQLARLEKLLELADRNELYLDLTGLNCFRLSKVPQWYDELSESDRWKTQALFWKFIAATCKGHSCVFCYDLMNEPVIGKAGSGEHPWLTGELGGFHFVQRICNEPGDRTQQQIASQWVRQMVAAIRSEDPNTLTTVGVIPWAMVWSQARPVFYTAEAAEHLDFVSIHYYPKNDRTEDELKALKVYDIGKPLVIEEVFPLECSLETLEQVIQTSDPWVEGWIAHYFGHTIEEHRDGAAPGGTLPAGFLEYWSAKQSSRKRSNK